MLKILPVAGSNSKQALGWSIEALLVTKVDDRRLAAKSVPTVPACNTGSGVRQKAKRFISFRKKLPVFYNNCLKKKKCALFLSLVYRSVRFQADRLYRGCTNHTHPCCKRHAIWRPVCKCSYLASVRYSTLRHITLIEKLSSLTVLDEVYNWIEDFIVQSWASGDVKAGVIQGSSLGPAA